MKRIATTVACLSAALSSVDAAPATRKTLAHPHHQSQEEATLGDALGASIREAVQGAVKKVKEHQAHHDDVSQAPGPHSLAQRASLRGGSAQANPWQPVLPLRVLSNDLPPIAPMDDLTQGIEAQRGDLLPPNYQPRVVYYPEVGQDLVNSFPQHYREEKPSKPENFVRCATSPTGWTDKKGIGCEYYATALWCTRDGKEGLKWQKGWGSLASFGVNAVGAAEACCQCGGGSRMKVIGDEGLKPLDARHLLSPPDRLPDPRARWFERNNFHLDTPQRPLRPNQAPEDYVPLPIRQVAPADKMGPHSAELKYSRYFHMLHEENQRKNPRGFSVRYYTMPPEDCSGAISMASHLDRALEYALIETNSSSDYSPVDLDAKHLLWPGKKTPPSGVYWTKWTGTLMILEPGRYNFNLDVGFNTVSSLKIDGQQVLTDGQCKVSEDDPTCTKKGCKWDKSKGSCKAEGGQHVLKEAPQICKKGFYRASPILFGCDPMSGEVEDFTVQPAGETTVLTIPAGVKNFHVAVESNTQLDLQMKDMGTNTWVVKFNGGIVNNQERDGTYHGMAISFSGSSPAHEFAKLQGVTTAPIEVSIKSYSGNPVNAKIIYSHQGLESCPGKKEPPKGCEKLMPVVAQNNVKNWSSQMIGRYHDCNRAWKAVQNVYPGGRILWGQWESVWSMAWGQEYALGKPGGAAAWQPGFAVVDASHDGSVSEPEFMASCNLMRGAPSPAPAPGGPPPGPNENQDVQLDKCLVIKVMDKSVWPKDAFKDTGFKDDPLLDQLIGHQSKVASSTDKGVKVPSPDGNEEWFFPKGTFYCIQATHSSNAPAGAPGVYVSSRAPAPMIANIVPVIVPGVMGGGYASAAALLEQKLPANPIKNSMDLQAGGHCIEAWVMVTPGGRNLKLKYSGPDTHKQELTVPGQLVHCDPVIPACVEPLRDSCLSFQPVCGPSPGPAPAGAASPA